MPRKRRQSGKAKAERRQDKRLTVGVVLRWIDERGEWAGASEVARERNVNLLTFPGGLVWTSDTRRRILHDLVGPENVDGIVVAQGWPDYETFTSARERFYQHLPVVNIQRLYKDCPGVIADNHRGTYDLMRHLIEVHGCRRIVFLKAQVDNPSADERYQAYVDALKAYDLPFDPDLVLPGDFSRQSGAQRMESLLDERGLRPPEDFEAIVAASDQIILGVLDVLQRRGIRVPEDVALAGFDDLDEAASLLPPLTTARLPNHEMGKRATELLLSLIHI